MWAPRKYKMRNFFRPQRVNRRGTSNETCAPHTLMRTCYVPNLSSKKQGSEYICSNVVSMTAVLRLSCINTTITTKKVYIVIHKCGCHLCCAPSYTNILQTGYVIVKTSYKSSIHRRDLMLIHQRKVKSGQ